MIINKSLLNTLILSSWRFWVDIFFSEMDIPGKSFVGFIFAGDNFGVSIFYLTPRTAAFLLLLSEFGCSALKEGTDGDAPEEVFNFGIPPGDVA